VAILLMAISGYSIGDHWWLNYHKLLVVILLVVINGYSIIHHRWLFY
jgi:hypothetical protein